MCIYNTSSVIKRQSQSGWGMPHRPRSLGYFMGPPHTRLASWECADGQWLETTSMHADTKTMANLGLSSIFYSHGVRLAFTSEVWGGGGCWWGQWVINQTSTRSQGKTSTSPSPGSHSPAWDGTPYDSPPTSDKMASFEVCAKVDIPHNKDRCGWRGEVVSAMSPHTSRVLGRTKP